MQITSTGPQILQLAQGEQKTLECTYTPAPEDVGELDIEWTLVSPDTTQKDKVVSEAGTKGTPGLPLCGNYSQPISFI